MKRLIYIIAIFFIGVWLTSCKTQQLSSNTETKYDSIVTEKLVPYALPEDSGRIRALLECSENGKVLLRWYDEEHSKRMKLQFYLDSLGRLQMRIKTVHDTVYLPQTTINVGKHSVIQKVIKVPVEKKLSWRQTLFIWTGGIAWIVGIILLAVWVNKKTGWTRSLWKSIKRVI